MADEKPKERQPKKPRRKKPKPKSRGEKGRGQKSRSKKAESRKEPAKTSRCQGDKKSRQPTKSRRRTGAVVVRASARYVRVAPRKARLVADQVRGLHIDQARALLAVLAARRRRSDIGKLIESAAANAENNHDLVADEMRIAEITVDEGPTLRRFRPRARGRATPIDKRTSHIAVALSPEEED